VRPGSTPLVSLLAQLSKLKLNYLPSVESITNNPSSLGEVLRKHLVDLDKKLLLVVDQLEELFSLCLELDQREIFSITLAQLARNAEEPIRLVITLRDDFLIRTQALTGLKERLNNGLYLLATPDKEDLLTILIKPAQQVGYEFEDQQLPIEIVNEVAQQPAALALLAFTGSKLWELRDRQFKQLRRKAYQAMGGVGGALAGHAESMMAQMATEEQGLVREVMRRLVTSEKTRAVVTRPELIQVLENPATESVLEKLITFRLLTAYEADDGVERIEIAHEALLTAWPRLVKWQQDMAEGSRLRDQLQTAARQWQERKRPKGLLWRDEALTEYKLWQSRYKIKLTELEKAFADASLAESQHIRNRNLMLVSSIILVLLLGSTILFWQRSKIETQLLNFYQEQGREELLKNNKDKALLYLAQAYSLGNNNASLRFMLTQALNQLENKRSQVLQGHNSWVKALAFSPDNKKLATASSDNLAIIWDVESGKILHKLIGHTASVNSLAFSSDGERLITGSNDQTIKIWQISSATLLDNIKFDSAISYVTFNPTGTHFAVVDYDKIAKIFDTNNKQVIFSLNGQEHNINTIAYSFDGKKIITANQDATAKIWDAEKGKLLATLSSHQDVLTSASFSPNGQYIATTSNDNSLKIWKADNLQLLYTLEADSQQAYFADFSSDSEKIVSIGHDQIVKIWEVKTGKQLFAFKEHTSTVKMAKFSSDGKYLATSSFDHSVRLWNLALDERSPEEISKIIKDKVQLKLRDEYIEPVVNNTVSTPVPKEVAKLTTPKIDFSNLKRFSFETVVTDKIGNIIARRSLEAPFYREELNNNKVFFDMVEIPGGTFIMGSREGEGNLEEYPEHQVSVKPFFMSKTEVTQALWQAVMGNNPSGLKGEDLPVETVNWYDAMLFCERLSQITGRQYRLPTEAEWEYAARAGSKTPFSFGENITTEIVNYDGTTPFGNAPKGIYRQKIIPVASLGVANSFGLYDMHGNVYEWCLDTGSYDYTDAPTDGYSREVPYSNSRVLRGGSWYYPALDARSAARASSNPISKLKSVGFRLVYQP
jgi:formylglycine-generating enzyme required for sulfatase activity